MAALTAPEGVEPVPQEPDAVAAAQLRQDLGELAARLDPQHTARAARQAEAEREVSLRPSQRAGGKRLVAELSAGDAMAAWLVLDARARRAGDGGVREDGSPEDRSLGQLRADALVGAVTGLIPPAHPTGEGEQGPRPGTPGGGGPGGEDGGAVPTPDGDGDGDEGPDDRGDDDPDRSAPAEDDRGGADPGGLGVDGSEPGGPDLGADAAPGRVHHPQPPARPATPALRWAELFGSWRPPVPVPTPHDLRVLCRTAVIIAASTLTGADEHPASVPAAGPLDAATVRRIALRARYRWMHTATPKVPATPAE